MVSESKQYFGNKLGAQIKKVRISKGISIRNFEMHEDSIDRFTLSKIENGKIMPSVYTLHKICKVLNIKLKVFFEGFDE